MRCQALVRVSAPAAGETLCTACRPPSVGTDTASMSPIRHQVFMAKYAELRQASDADPRNVALRLDAARVAETLGLTVEAVEHLRAAVEEQPNHLEAAARYKALRREMEAAERRDAGEYAPPPRRPHRDDPPFWNDLGNVLAYPLRGRGKTVLMAGAIFFAIAELTSALSMIGGIVMLFIWGYVVGYLFDVIGSTGAGKDQPPELPEVASFLDSMLFPAVTYATISLFAFLPCIVVVALGATLGIGALPTMLLGLLAFAAGCFAFPMCLMVRGLMQDWKPAVNPIVVFGAIARVLPDYLAAFVALAVMWSAYVLAIGVTMVVVTLVFGPPTADAVLNVAPMRILGWIVMAFISWPMLLYCITLEGHILGRVYRQGATRLGWFVQRGTASRPSAKPGAMLWIAALGACLLFGAVGFGALKLYSQTSGRGTFTAPRFPAPRGGQLTYYWESTDGPAGLVTYEFQPQPDGTVTVTIVTRRPEEPPEEAYRAPVGTVNTTTAMWISAEPVFVGDERLPIAADMDVMLYGPLEGNVGSPYVAGWSVKELTTWQNQWDVYRVIDDMSGDVFYDTRTGVLVGRRWNGVGVQVEEWLVSHDGIPGLGACPPPNRRFPGGE